MRCQASSARSPAKKAHNVGAMSFPDTASRLAAAMPKLRGKLIANQPMADLTWSRVGGPAQTLFSPADEEAIAYFVSNLADDVPVTVVGLGSNLLVRDGGVPGVVIRLGRGFNEILIERERVRAGRGAPDGKGANAAGGPGRAGRGDPARARLQRDFDRRRPGASGKCRAGCKGRQRGGGRGACRTRILS